MMDRTTQNQVDLSLQSPERGFVSVNPAERWEHALLSGNGVMGTMVYGRPLDETIILSRAGLFMPLDPPLPPPNTGAHLAEIRAMLAAGQYQPAADFVVDLSLREGWAGKQWTDPFIPACDLLVRTPERGPVRRYARSVDFATGVASVAWDDDRGATLRRSFVSRADNVVVLSVTGPVASGPGDSIDCDVSFAARPTTGQGGWRPQWFFDECIASVEATAEAEWLTYRSEFKRRWPGSLQGYEVVARVVRRAGELLVIARVVLSNDFNRSQVEPVRAELSAIVPDFHRLLAAHAPVHGKIFDRARLRLGASEADHTLPTERLIAGSEPGRSLPALVEKQFDAARYTILSATGELPPVLPGIWVGTWGAPWSGDFTQNGNLQTALAGNLSTNMAELMEPYFRYLESQLPDYRTNARRLYGARGIHVPSRTSSHGLDDHFDGTWPMTFWTAGAGWAAHFYYDYYLYTGDRQFLADRAMPFMKEAAAFYEDFLFEGPDGRYVFSPSYSPENNPANEGSQACVNATMDVAVARELLTNLVSAGHALGTDANDVARWQAMRAKLPDYQVNEDGALKEWTFPGLHDRYTHRHASHLYPLYYGMPPEVASDARLREAFRVALEKRLEYRRQETTGEMAFGLVQMGDCAATLRDARACDEIVQWLVNWYWSPALNTTHDRHNIFNVDICGGFPALVTRLLVDAQPGRIDLLPLVPGRWPTGRIEGIRCRGQVEVKRLDWTPERVTAELWSAIDQSVVVSIRGKMIDPTSVELLAGKTVALELE